MEFDSHSTKSPSWMTGTRRLGFCARSFGSVSTCSKCRSSSAQVHSTLRTLIEEVLPSTRSVMAKLLRLAADLLDAAIDDGDDHERFARAEVVCPGLDDGLAHLGVAAGVLVGRAHVFDPAFARGRRAAFPDQLLEHGLVVDDPLATA